jgi:hypothetical protein
MDIRGAAATTGVVLAATLWGASASQAAASCPPVPPGQTRTLLDRVPTLVAAHMTATGDGGAVIAFASYRGTREFPGRDFTVLALDSSGCMRWRASLPGPWPIARPALAGPGSIVVASAADKDPERRIAGGLRVYTLSASSGRILRRDVFPSLASSSGFAPTLVGDRRGDVAVVLTTVGRSGPVPLKLTHPAGARRWSHQVIGRSNTQFLAAMARSDGAMVVGYPRGGRFWVRAGTVAGRLGAPTDAGPISRNFRAGDIALGADGTVAAVWEATTYSHPWRLRAAVRPAMATRFAPFAQLGFAASRRNTFFGASSPTVRVGAGGRVTVGFNAPGQPPVALRVLCASTTPAGRFARARQIAAEASGDPFAPASIIFGPAGSAAVLTGSVVTVGAGCEPGSPEPLSPVAGTLRQALIDARGRVWVLGQDGPSVSSRRPLQLTIGSPR